VTPFWKSFLAFVLPVAAACAFVEWRVRSQPTGYGYVEQLIREKGARTKVVVIGDSQALYGIQPSELGVPALNLSNVSQSIPLTRQILEKNLAQFPCLKLVILGLSPFTLEYQLAGQPDEERLFFHMQINGVPGDGPWWYQLDPRRFSRALALGPKKARRWLMDSFRGENPIAPYDPWGWFDGENHGRTVKTMSEDAGKARSEYHKAAMDPKLTGRVAEELMRLQSLLKQRGIDLKVVRMPTSEFYQRAFWPQNPPDKSFVNTDFVNTDHLNRRGAKKFTEFLRDSIIKTYDFTHQCP